VMFIAVVVSADSRPHSPLARKGDPFRSAPLRQEIDLRVFFFVALRY